MGTADDSTGGAVDGDTGRYGGLGGAAGYGGHVGDGDADGHGGGGAGGRGAGSGVGEYGGDGQRVVRRDEAVRAAVERGLLGPAAPVVGLLDVAGIRESAAALRAAFDAVLAPGTPVLHAFAVKATPLVPVLRLLDA